MKMNRKLFKLSTLLMALVMLVSLVMAGCAEVPDESSDTTASAGESSQPSQSSSVADTTAPDELETTPTYQFTVIYSDTEEPVQGVRVQLCHNESQVCLMPKSSDEQGKVSYPVADGYDVYQIHIIGILPDGYIFDNEAHLTSADVQAYTLVLERVYEVDSLCTALEKYDGANKVEKSGPAMLTLGAVHKLTMTEKRLDDLDDPNAEVDSFTATRQDDSYYYFAVKPSKPSDAGHYKVTVFGLPEGVTIRLANFPASGSYVSPDSDVYSTGNRVFVEFNMEEKQMKDSTGQWSFDNRWVFGIRVEGEFPIDGVSAYIKVERTRDIVVGEDVMETTRSTVEIQEGAVNASQVVDITGKTLTAITKDAASGITVVLGDDHYYHIGDKNGAILMVNITTENAFFEDQSFLTVNAASGTDNLKVSEKISDMKYHVYYYAEMLKAYGQLCNADGYYPVNEQLYTFLTTWVNQSQKGSEVIAGLDEAHAFLLACGYYN